MMARLIGLSIIALSGLSTLGIGSALFRLSDPDAHLVGVILCVSGTATLAHFVSGA